VLLWTTETVLPQGDGRQVAERVAIFACLEQTGERFLEVRRTTHFQGFPGDPIHTILELKLPWGAATPPAKAPPSPP